MWFSRWLAGFEGRWWVLNLKVVGGGGGVEKVIYIYIIIKILSQS